MKMQKAFPMERLVPHHYILMKASDEGHHPLFILFPQPDVTCWGFDQLGVSLSSLDMSQWHWLCRVFSLQGGKKMLKPYFTEMFCELHMQPAHSHLLPDGQDMFPSGMGNCLTLTVRMGLDPTLCSKAQKQSVEILEEEWKVSCALRSWKKRRFGALHLESHILSKTVCYFYHPEWSL